MQATTETTEHEHLRGSIGDAERRMARSQLALARAAECLRAHDPDEARSWLDDADAEAGAAREEIRAGLVTLGAARRASTG